MGTRSPPARALRRWALVVGGTAALGGLLGVSRGCGSESSARGAQPIDAPLAACSTTVESMNGRSCVEPLTCGFSVLCGAFRQRATCTCTGGRVSCTDGSGTLDVDASPRCVDAPAASDEPCPATLALARDHACDTTGELCFFEGAMCAQGVRNLDYCQCALCADGEMRFTCRVVPCPPE